MAISHQCSVTTATVAAAAFFLVAAPSSTLAIKSAGNGKCNDMDLSKQNPANCIEDPSASTLTWTDRKYTSKNHDYIHQDGFTYIQGALEIGAGAPCPKVENSDWSKSNGNKPGGFIGIPSKTEESLVVFGCGGCVLPAPKGKVGNDIMRPERIHETWWLGTQTIYPFHVTVPANTEIQVCCDGCFATGVWIGKPVQEVTTTSTQTTHTQFQRLSDTIEDLKKKLAAQGETVTKDEFGDALDIFEELEASLGLLEDNTNSRLSGHDDDIKNLTTTTNANKAKLDTLELTVSQISLKLDQVIEKVDMFTKSFDSLSSKLGGKSKAYSALKNSDGPSSGAGIDQEDSGDLVISNAEGKLKVKDNQCGTVDICDIVSTLDSIADAVYSMRGDDE